jgi:hypothetical protein
MKKMNILRHKSRQLCIGLTLAAALAGSACAQSCFTSSDMEEATRTALINTAKRYFDMAARGDSAGLRQNSIGSLASDFSNVETAVKDNQSAFAAVQATPRPPYFLKIDGTAPLERAEFLCGVFGSHGQTADSAVFVIPNLPPGNYAIAILDIPAGTGPVTLSFVLQQQGSDWKLGGFYVKPTQAKSHDGNWFAERAREFKAKGQTHNAWFYFLEARDLSMPVPFMSTMVSDKLYDEAQAVRPADLPPSDLSASGKIFKLTNLFGTPVGKDFDLVVKFQAADVSNTTLTYQDNMAVIKALVAKYPEFRDAFDGVVARAVEPSGRDYGSLLAMKDIK